MTAPGVLHVALPGGVRLGPGAPLLREVALRAPSAADETFVLDSAQSLLPCERATLLLGRCLCVDGADGESLARALTIGDREALLLQLRRHVRGDVLDCVLACPAAACGEAMDLSLRVTDLLVAPYDDARDAHEIAVDAGGGVCQITFRLPAAADLDMVAALARRDPGGAARELLRRCVLRIADDGTELPFESLADRAQAAIAAAMAEHDPQAELELQLACPTCGTAFSTVFDTATFLLCELEDRALRLVRDVHVLALHYHWSEAEIVALPPARRARYLELLGGAAPA